MVDAGHLGAGAGPGGPAVRKSASQLSASAASVRQKKTDVPSGAAIADEVRLAGAAVARQQRREQPLGALAPSGAGSALSTAIAATRGPRRRPVARG